MNTIQGTERDPWIKNATHRTRADLPPSKKNLHNEKLFFSGNRKDKVNWEDELECVYIYRYI